MSNIENIDHFEEGKLKGENQLKFRKSLQSDANLARDMQLYRFINKSLIQKTKNELYNTLNQIHANNKPKGIIRSIAYYRVAAVAAAITILITVGVLLMTMFSKPSNDQLFASYFEPQKSVLNVRSEGINMEQTIVQGMQLFELQQFGEAIEMFNLAPANLLGKLYGGIAMMEIKDFNSAIERFTYIIEHDDNLFIDQAEWYLSLCYIKTNQIDKATVMLNKIVSENTKYKSQSLTLMDDLKKRK